MSRDDRATRVAWERTDAMARPRMLANVRRGLFGVDASRLRIGRYELLRPLGVGSVGTVFEAFDPQLHRHVALKLVPADDYDRSESILDEAQALARLEHPNVVRVFDAGTHAGGVWVVMERLYGHDLRELRSPHGRSAARTLGILRQLAAGLVAVHEAGIVHRDVKPSNVFLCTSGHVRLVDFGLARDAAAPDATSDAGDSIDARVGSVVGTPAYMAPEQHRGEPVNAAADQYAFCVIAWELLYGRRPFGGDDADALYCSKRELSLARDPLRRDVSRALHRVLLRGLAFDAHARWPSLRELGERLESAADRRFPQRVALLGALAAVAAVAWATDAHDCEDARSPSWTEHDRKRIGTAIIGDGTSLRRETWERVEDRVDDAMAALASAHVDTCRAAREGAVNGEIADQRFACLAQRRRDLDSVLMTLETGHDDAVERAVVWLAGVDSPWTCTTVDATTTEPVLPAPRIADDVAHARDRLAAARDAARRGEAEAASELARAVWRDAEELGFDPLVAEVELEIGRLHRLAREWEPAESFLTAAYFRARASSYAHVEVRAALELVELLAGGLWRTEDADRWLQRARAVRADAWPSIGVSVLAYDAMLQYQRQDYPAALATSFSALANARALPDDTLALALADNTTVALIGAQRFAEALALAREVVADRSRILGAEHPSRARSLQNLAIAAWEHGEIAQAHDAFERVVEILREGGTSDEHALGLALVEYGQRLADEGDTTGASARLDEAAALLERSVGDSHPAFISCTFLRGHVLLLADRHDAAAPLFERALVLSENHLGSEHTVTGWALAGKGRVQLIEGDIDAARATLERAWSILATTDPSADLALVRLALADAIWRGGGSRADAVALAEGARPLVDGTHPWQIANARRVEAWLETHSIEVTH